MVGMDKILKLLDGSEEDVLLAWEFFIKYHDDEIEHHYILLNAISSNKSEWKDPKFKVLTVSLNDRYKDDTNYIIKSWRNANTKIHDNTDVKDP